MFDFTSILHTSTFTLSEVAIIMGVALILGLTIAFVYKSSHTHTSSFAVVLAVLPILEATLILMLNGNLGATVVVLGTFGLIRFRSVPGSAWDIGFIFFAMVIGLAVGLGFITLALALTVFVGLIVFLLERLHFGTSIPKEKQLRITIPEDMAYNEIFHDLIKTYTNSARLDRVKTTNMGTMFDLSYVVDLKDPAKEKDFIDAIRVRNGNLNVSLGTVLRNKDEL